MTYLDRDLSWLSFNERVLLEAQKSTTPLRERVKFLAIYSSNLDEFYRVRVATIRRALTVEDQLDQSTLVHPPSELLSRIQATVNRHLSMFGEIFTTVFAEWQTHGLHVYREATVPEAHLTSIRHYFRSEVLSFLQPVTTQAHQTYFLENQHLYLLFWLAHPTESTQHLAYVNIPSDELSRFFVLDESNNERHLMMLDDVIRLNYSFLFPDYQLLGSYSVLMNRDADLGIEDEYAGNLVETIRDRVKERERGSSVRFLYDAALPEHLLPLMQRVFQLDTYDLVRGGRYHRMKDLFSLPLPKENEPDLAYDPQPVLQTSSVPADVLIRQVLDERDLLLHFPYHSYDSILQFFNEAAIDPAVTSIQATFYRIAEDSRIANALVSAARNGKQIDVFMEVKARFDEQNNLRWSEALETAGARVHYSLPGMKVHAKAALATRSVGGAQQRYGILTTGNFNEDTATLYSDLALLTANQEVTEDLFVFFRCLFERQPVPPLQHLLVAPYNLQSSFLEKIDREIDFAQRGKPAELLVKVNNLEDRVMIDKLYEAHRAGVRVSLHVRSICCLATDVPGESEGLVVRRLVDRYLEHLRAFYFLNGGAEELYLASADWMRRNLYSRIELAFPVLGESQLDQVKKILSFHQQDNVQAVHFTADYANRAIPVDGPKIRAQYATYHWLREQEAQ
ncbi:MAG: polyphosphate kinase 1 [Tunicatimonas sp.]